MPSSGKGQLDFAKLLERCETVVAAHATRNTMYSQIEQMYHMDWSDKPTQEYVKPTMSPDPQVAITGVVRLLTSTDPVINVIGVSDEPAQEERADRLEKLLRALWYRANSARRWPVHYDACKSAALFSEVCIEVANLGENVRWMEVAGRDASELKRQTKRCPFAYSVHHPACVYPQFGAFGLRSVLHRYRRRLWEVREWWGKEAEHVAGEDMDWITYSDYWDAVWRVVWVGSADKPILSVKHELPFIPWVCAVVDGSGMWSEPEHQRMPLLYAVWKGHWWQRQNLLYSVFYTLAAQMGWPTWVMTTVDGRSLDVDLNKPGGQINLQPGESVVPLQKMLIDEAVKQGLSIADSKLITCTLPRVVFGESPGSTMSYSAMNLLSQGGRLPLVPIERQVGNALAEMFDITLRWIEHSGTKIEVYHGGVATSAAASEIKPDEIEIEVKLKADVPQDRLSLANVVQLLRQRGPDGLPQISSATASELLGFMQAGEERERVIREEFEGRLVAEQMGGAQAKVEPQQGAMGASQAPMGIPPVQMGPPMMPGQGGAIQEALGESTAMPMAEY